MLTSPDYKMQTLSSDMHCDPGGSGSLPSLLASELVPTVPPELGRACIPGLRTDLSQTEVNMDVLKTRVALLQQHQ